MRVVCVRAITGRRRRTYDCAPHPSVIAVPHTTETALHKASPGVPDARYRTLDENGPGVLAAGAEPQDIEELGQFAGPLPDGIGLDEFACTLIQKATSGTR